MRAKLILKGTGSTAGILHGWAAYTYVGTPEQYFSTGDGICQAETLNRQVFGYGALSAGAQDVTIYGRDYRSDSCQDGAVTVGAGSVVEVWVEDSAAQCQGKDITAKSYRTSVGDVVKGLNTSAQSLLSSTIQLVAAGTLSIMGQTELTTSSTSNSCGAKTEIAYAYAMLNGGFPANVTDAFSPSGGLSHVLLSTEYVSSQAAGQVEIGIGGAVNNTYRAAAYPLSELASNPGHYLGTFIGYPETGIAARGNFRENCSMIAGSKPASVTIEEPIRSSPTSGCLMDSICCKPLRISSNTATPDVRTRDHSASARPLKCCGQRA